MTTPPAMFSEPELKRFLTRRLDEAERERMEERIFTDDELFSRTVEVEEDLLDEYARGALEPHDRAAVEQRMAIDQRFAARVEFARLLAERTERPANVVALRSAAMSPTRKARLLMAAAVVTPLLAVTWFAAHRTTTEAPTPSSVIPSSVIAKKTVRGHDIRERVASHAITVVALSLASVRGDESRTVVHVGAADTVRLNVAIDPAEPYKEFRLSLTGGAATWSAAARRNGNVVSAEGAASAIGVGRRELGVEGVGAGGRIEELGFIELDVRK